MTEADLNRIHAKLQAEAGSFDAIYHCSSLLDFAQSLLP